MDHHQYHFDNKHNSLFILQLVIDATILDSVMKGTFVFRIHFHSGQGHHC